jgi:uncharacterized protein
MIDASPLLDMTPLPLWLNEAALIFVSLFVQGLPFLLGGALLGAVLSSVIPFSAVLQRWPKSAFWSSVAGAGFAAFLPACDCAAVPMVRRLLTKGLPASAAISYLLAAPGLNPICLVSTYLAYRSHEPWTVVGWRVGGSFFLAVFIGWIASRLPLASLFKGETLLSTGSNAPESWVKINPRLGRWGKKGAEIILMAGTDFLSVSIFYILGALFSSLLQSAWPLAMQVASQPDFSVSAALFLAFTLSLCSSADAFIVSSFTALPLKGELAFLWFGPIFNLRMLFIYRTIFQYRAILGLGLLAFALVYLMASRLVL